MNNELIELLSKEKANVLRTKRERVLPEGRKAKIIEERRIGSILDRAELNEKELLTLIAKGFINLYGNNKERALFEDKADRFIETTVGTVNLYEIEPNVIPKDIYFKKACERGKRKAKQTDRSLLIWRNRTTDRYGNNSVELVYLNNEFLKEQNIEVKYYNQGRMCFTTDIDSLNEFVNKVLNSEFDEIKLDNSYIKEFENRLKRINETNIRLNSIKRDLLTNAKIITLGICKKVIELYNSLELDTKEKNKSFLVNVYDEDWQVKDLFEEEKWNIFTDYYYEDEIIAVEYDGKYLPTLKNYLNNALREIGVKYNSDSTGEFIVNISKFEDAVLSASREEKGKTSRKV